MKISSLQEVDPHRQIEIRHLLEGADANDALAVFAATIPPNVRVPVPPQITSMIRLPSLAICTIPGSRGSSHARRFALEQLPMRSRTTIGGAPATFARSTKS